MDVSIIIPIHNPDRKIISDIDRSIKNQKFKGKIEVIRVEKSGWGLAKQINYGIRKAKNKIVITLHQDCIPKDEKWLSNLVKPLENKGVVASVSSVELPKSIWDEFDVFAKALTINELGIIKPAMDEKGCAFKKEALIKAGLFDEVNFRTAGEDLDMYSKLIKIGKVVNSKAIVLHIHPTSLLKRLKKVKQNANGMGAIIRIHGTRIGGKNSLIRAAPILGWLSIILKFNFKPEPRLYINYLTISPIVHLVYLYGFWKGYLMGRQTI